MDPSGECVRTSVWGIKPHIFLLFYDSIHLYLGSKFLVYLRFWRFSKTPKKVKPQIYCPIYLKPSYKKVRFPLNSQFLAVSGPSLGFESLKFASQKWLLFLETKGSLIKFSKNMNFGEKVPEKPNQNVVSLTITAKKI